MHYSGALFALLALFNSRSLSVPEILVRLKDLRIEIDTMIEELESAK